jgi:hypothetical protein
MPMYQKKKKTEETKNRLIICPLPGEREDPWEKKLVGGGHQGLERNVTLSPFSSHRILISLRHSSKNSRSQTTTKENGKGPASIQVSQRTVIGLPQARAYCRYMGCRLKLTKCRTVFRFGVGDSKSRGILHMRIPTPNESFMLLAVDVVDADIPFLVGLDILDLFQLNVDTVQNQLRAPNAGPSLS